MTTALDYSEDSTDPDAEFWDYALAGNPLPKPAGYTGPRSYFEYLQTVKKKGKHGEAFGYRTISADALSWLIARTSGKSVADLFSERIWSRIGAEREAFFTVDSTGTPFAGGGFNAILRDMARLGQLMLNEGRVNGEQIIPAAAIDRIRNGGKKETFAKADYPTLPGWSYGGLWWISNDDHGAYAARGVHGQTVWINPAANMVIVRLGFQNQNLVCSAFTQAVRQYAAGGAGADNHIIKFVIKLQNCLLDAKADRSSAEALV